MNKADKMMNKQEITDLFSEQWSNAACCGYVIRACKSINLDKATTDHILKGLQDAFEAVTVEQAEKIYCDF